MQLLADGPRHGRVGRHATLAPPTWDIVAEPLAGPLDRLDRAWGAVRHLNAVVNTPRMARAPITRTCPRSPRSTPTSRRTCGCIASYRALAAAPAFAALDAAQRRAVDNELRDFRLGGAELADAAEGAVQGRAGRARASSPRSSTTTCSTPPTRGRTTSTIANELAGVPDDVVAEARAAAEADGKPGWKLTLRMPCYLPVMQYADNRALRATLHRAYRDARVRSRRQPRVGQRRR